MKRDINLWKRKEEIRGKEREKSRTFNNSKRKKRERRLMTERKKKETKKKNTTKIFLKKRKQEYTHKEKESQKINRKQ